MNRYIDDLNYYTDPRVNVRADGAPVVLVPIAESADENGLAWDFDEIELPSRFDVCPTCRGNGTHVNPAIDCNGLTAEDFADDPDFARDYMRGTYDVPCNECDGRRVVLVVDEAACDPDLLRLYQEQQRESAQARVDESRAMALGY